jgi:hypothetical protein
MIQKYLIRKSGSNKHSNKMTWFIHTIAKPQKYNTLGRQEKYTTYNYNNMKQLFQEYNMDGKCNKKIKHNFETTCLKPANLGFNITLPSCIRIEGTLETQEKWVCS